MTELDRIKNFDALPDDSIVSRKVAAIVLGESERTLQPDRDPPIKLIRLSERRVGFRVGDIRAFVRGTASATA